jgi:hypothetical protein
MTDNEISSITPRYRQENSKNLDSLLWAIIPTAIASGFSYIVDELPEQFVGVFFMAFVLPAALICGSALALVRLYSCLFVG